MMQIIGKGGFAREVAAYFDEYPIIHFENDCPGIENGVPTVIAIGDPTIRKQVAERFNDLQYATLSLGSSVKGNSLSMGCIICPGTFLTVDVQLGKHVIVNLNCTIGHDCRIGNFVTISPGVNISGNVTIGDLCYIGTNAVVREKISICGNVVIGAGAVVVKDITEPGTYVGNPAMKIK